MHECSMRDARDVHRIGITAKYRERSTSLVKLEESRMGDFISRIHKFQTLTYKSSPSFKISKSLSKSILVGRSSSDKP